jgi:hypothetical protein
VQYTASGGTTVPQVGQRFSMVAYFTTSMAPAMP